MVRQPVSNIDAVARASSQAAVLGGILVAIGLGFLIANSASYGPWAAILIFAGACLFGMGMWGRRKVRRARTHSGNR
jgi:F0F1-type ATP synthase assembly protein I